MRFSGIDCLLLNDDGYKLSENFDVHNPYSFRMADDDEDGDGNGDGDGVTDANNDWDED
jgi:hypothetical protein